jgi:hypothetical protein
MSEIIAYHKKTKDYALLKDEFSYWIGEFDPYLVHQNGEPLYVWIATADSEEHGLKKLNENF